MRVASGTLGFALGVAACAGGPPGVTAPTAPVRPTSPPNIVLIVTDDLDARSFAFMPRVKSLIGDHGVLGVGSREPPDIFDGPPPGDDQDLHPRGCGPLQEHGPRVPLDRIQRR